ncbi:MAG TPA: response regulator [Candidatus Dormibacteraeota bacterium]|nr:response regulator [Candidatus Dormibacteraeota bacterium]
MGRILIVDDSELMRKKLAFIFEQENHEIVGQAENGLEAIKLFKDKKPDLITMDLTMPVMDGIEAIKEIIQIDPLATIVVCSAMGQQKIIVKAIKEGAKDFIIKPFHEELVIETIHNIFQSYKQTKE